MALNHQQELFVQEWLKDQDTARAYLAAGYDVKDEKVAGSNGRRLLRHAAVLDAIDKAHVERMERLKIDGDWIVERARLTYLMAMRDGDYGNALKALDMIAKLLGEYEEHNRQKSGQESAEAIRQRLKERGLNLDHLQPILPN